MATLIRSLTNASSVNTLTLAIAGFDPTESLVIAPSATVDLLTVMTADSLHSMQAQLASIVAAGEVTVAATIDSSELYPAGWAPSTVTRYSNIGVTTDISTYTTAATIPITGFYQIGAYRVATAGATGTDDPGNLIVNWTDETGPQALQFDGNTGTASGSFGGLTMFVHAIGGTVVKYYTSGVSGPWATLVENIYISVVQL